MQLDSFNCAFCTSPCTSLILGMSLCTTMLGNFEFTNNSRWGHDSEHPGSENSTTISVLHDSNHFDELDDLESKK